MQTNSAITTFQRAAGSEIGMPLGGRGLATLGLSTVPLHATPDMAAAILRSSPVFSGRRLTDEAEAEAIRDLVAYVEKPATRKWIAGRALTLLSQYFAPNMDETVSAAIADDWCEMLSGYPAWAISNGCRWWMSRENQNKSRRPLPGDIQDATSREMGPIRQAKVVLGYGVKATGQEQPKEITPEELDHRRAVSAEVLGKWNRMNEE